MADGVLDLSQFYPVAATVLAASVVAALITLNQFREVVRTPTGTTLLIYKVVLTVWALIVFVAGLILASLPAAVSGIETGGTTEWLGSPDTVVTFVGAVVGVAFAAPIGLYMISVWRRETPNPASTNKSDHAPTTDPPDQTQGRRTRSVKVVGVSLAVGVALGLAARRR